MKIYFIRHGVTELNKQGFLNGQIDEPLAPEGFEQAKAAALILPKSIKHIYTSSMLRARQTTKSLNAELGLPVSHKDELREMHMGSVAGRSWDTIESGQERKKVHRSMQFDYRAEGGESSEGFKSRVVTFLGEINNQHDDYEALVVAHGGVLRLLHLLEQDTEHHAELENAVLLTFDVDRILKNDHSA